MPSLWDRLFGREPSSAEQAKERLKLVLVHDRTDISPGTLDLLKDELIATISRYIEIGSRQDRDVAGWPRTAFDRGYPPAPGAPPAGELSKKVR
jgi:cell division topological specificity factor MinE